MPSLEGDGTWRGASSAGLSGTTLHAYTEELPSSCGYEEQSRELLSDIRRRGEASNACLHL